MTKPIKRAFVTGGSGFVGSRLIESLVLDHGIQVRALVHSVPRAVRVARFPVEFVFGSITDAEAMTEALKGCDVVFHLAYGKAGTEKEKRRVTVESTRALAEAALVNGVDKFVYVSTAAVYGDQIEGSIDETALRKPNGWHYSDTKLEAEELVIDLCRQRGLRGTILQLVGVYGPWGGTFTIAPLHQLSQGRVVLVDDGVGIMNATYVDDVVLCLLLAAVRDEAVGEIFLVKGPGVVTRRQFLECYQRMLGVDSLVSMSRDEIRERQRTARRQAIRSLIPEGVEALRKSEEFRAAFLNSPLDPIYTWVRRSVSQFRPRRPEKSDNLASPISPIRDKKPLFLPPEFMINRLASRAEFSTAKAEKVLGFKPTFNLEKGMELTESWAKWARLL